LAKGLVLLLRGNDRHQLEMLLALCLLLLLLEVTEAELLQEIRCVVVGGRGII
jgi:hypothetical protein